MSKINFIKKCWRCPSGQYAWQVLDRYGAIYDSGKETTRTEAEKIANEKKRDQIRKALAEMPAPEPPKDPSEARRKFKSNTHSLFIRKDQYAKAT